MPARIRIFRFFYEWLLGRKITVEQEKRHFSCNDILLTDVKLENFDIGLEQVVVNRCLKLFILKYIYSNDFHIIEFSSCERICSCTMSAFSPLPTRYGIPHGVGFPKSCTNELIPHQTGLYSMSPCACCYRQTVYFHPQIVQETKGQWTTHGPTYEPLFYQQESIVPQKDDKQVKTTIEYKKPKLSYVELIAEAILSSPEKHLVLGDIYEAIAEKHPYFENRGSGWRNSIRHNLSLSDCFIKGERSPNGKGHFWEVNFECYGENHNGKGKPKLHKKKMAARLKTQNDFFRYKLNPEKAGSINDSAPGDKKLSMLTQLRFDDEIREFENARKQLTDVRQR